MSDSSKGRICPKCQAANFAGDVYCFNCGTNLEDEKTLSFAVEAEPAAAPRDFLDFPPGARFADRYQIVEEIGYGSMGRVFKARDLKLDQVVALKMIRPEDAASPVILNIFKKETQLARSLAQENIIRVYDLGESRGVTFISMEYVSGQNLEQLLRASGPLAEETAVSITRQICRALAAAHRRGIVHRDLKPQNVLIDAEGRVRVADFGLARMIETPAGSTVGRIVGTPAYMSPEQAEGREVDARTDMYSLGVILYEMLTGRKPFVSRTIAGYIEKHLREKPVPPRTWNPRISARMEALILGCLEKNPARRPVCAGGILNDMEERRPAKAERRNRRLLFFGLPATAAVLLAAAVVFFVFRKPAPPLPPPGGRPAVAVMYFENNTGDPDLEYLRKGLCYQIIQSLLPSPRLRVITSDRLFAVLQDRDLLDNATYSTDDLKQVAERTQARFILQGSFAKIGRAFKIHSLLLDTATWESAGSIQKEIDDLGRLNAAVEEMTPEIRAALSLPREGAPAETAARLDQITTRSPAALKSFIEGETLYREGKFLESAEAFQKAVEADPEFALAIWHLAMAELYLRRRTEAKAHIEEALRLSSAGRASVRDQYLLRGFYHSVFGTSVRQVVTEYETLLSLYPDDADGLMYLGILYRNLEEWIPARNCFERLLLQEKFNPLTYINLSTIYMALGLYDKAAEILPSDPALLSEILRVRYLSLVHLCQGRYDQARTEIERALELEPDRPGLLHARGNVHQLRGDLVSAGADYRRISENPDVGWRSIGLRSLALLALQEGRFKESRALSARGIELASEAGLKDDEYLFRLLQAAELSAAGDGAAAEASARAAGRMAEELNESDLKAEALGLLGKIQSGRGDAAGAEAAAERLNRLIDESGRNYLRLHYLHLKGTIALAAGDLAAAAENFRAASERLSFQCNPSDPHAYYDDAQARVAEKAGRTDEAISLYRGIIARTTGRLGHGDIYVRSYYRLGKLYLKRNLRTEAADAFDRFLKLWAGADRGLPEVTDARIELAALRPAGRRPVPRTDPAP